ncbi:MAG TPA: PKD domain-containing protein [Thermoanaerobaculia bacterium]|nr:PKD domain-containing protein [Thermoanaerobaculia bacterium]
MIRKAPLFVVTWLAAASIALAANRVVPVAGHLPGANGTTWTTDLSLTNNSSSTAFVDLVFHPAEGAARTRTISMAAGQSLLIEDAVNPADLPGANPASWLGQLEVRSASDVTAEARIFTAASNGGTFGSTFQSFDPAALSDSGSIAGLIVSGRFRTNVAFANPNDVLVTFSYTLRDQAGISVATRTISVPAHGTIQLSLSDDVAASSDDRRLMLEWTSTRPAYVVGSLVDNKSGDPTNLQSIATGSTTLSFPVVGKTPGGLSTFWATSASISSTSDLAGSVTFLYQDNATGTSFTKTVPVPARGTIRTDDLNDFLGAPLGSGSLTVTATVRVVGAVRVFNTQTDGSTFGSAVLPQSPVVAASKVRIHGVRRDDQYRLNVAISNGDDALAADGVVRLFDDRGRQVEVEPFHVEHGTSVQVPLSGNATEVRSGQVEVETEHGVTVTVLASNIDNRTGDTVVHESEQENERQSELEIRMTPSTAPAGTPVTFTVGNAANITSVAWNFGDGTTGSGVTATHAYASAGEYDVTATITLTGGAIVRDREDIHITGSGTTTPTQGAIDFTWSPSSPTVGQQVTFTASGTANGGTFKWKFPGDVRPTGSAVTFTFNAPGSYEVELELEHSGAETVEVKHIVTVGSSGGTTNPGGGAAVTSIDFTSSPATPKAGQPATFTATFNTTPPSGSTVKWRFPDDARPTGNPVTFTFSAPGTYKVRAELEHAGDPSIEKEKTITVVP